MRSCADRTVIKEITSRFVDVVVNELSLNFNELSKELMYENQSPLTKVIKGDGFIGPDKLRLFAVLENNNGQVPNLHWIFTGCGDKMLFRNEKNIYRSSQIGQKLIDRIGLDKATKLLDIFE